MQKDKSLLNLVESFPMRSIQEEFSEYVLHMLRLCFQMFMLSVSDKRFLTLLLSEFVTFSHSIYQRRKSLHSNEPFRSHFGLRTCARSGRGRTGADLGRSAAPDAPDLPPPGAIRKE